MLVAATKQCGTCGLVLSVEYFHKGKAALGRKSVCKSCSKQYKKEWYEKNKQRLTALAKKKDAEYKAVVHTFICDYLSCHPCVDCGESDISVLEFDHRENKLAGISNLIQAHYSPFVSKELVNEIEKCDVRCANCHQRRHAVETNNYRVRYMKVNPKG